MADGFVSVAELEPGNAVALAGVDVAVPYMDALALGD